MVYLGGKLVVQRLNSAREMRVVLVSLCPTSLAFPKHPPEQGWTKEAGL